MIMHKFPDKCTFPTPDEVEAFRCGCTLLAKESRRVSKFLSFVIGFAAGIWSLVLFMIVTIG